MLTLIGLGPADAGSLSMAARTALRAAPNLFLRTARHPAADDLLAENVAFESFDCLYETEESFEAVYEAIALKVLEKAKIMDTAYAVPGHPLVAEESVKRILARARNQKIPVCIAGSASFIEPALEAIGHSLDEGLLLVDALSLGRISLQPDVPILLYQVYDRAAASEAKLVLMREFPDDWPVTLIRQAGVPGEQSVHEIPLYRLDREDSDHLTVVFVPVLPPEKRRKRLSDLVDVMAHLRAEGGCPWDREQTHKSLRKYLIEECYEAIEAIDDEDPEGLCEELGDVLLQVVFHSQLMSEEGLFTIDDVTRVIVEKLIRRHPHVFGEVSVSGSEEVLKNWEQIKRSEKDTNWRNSVLDGVPSGMPALIRAMEISKKAAKVGFEWEKFEDVVAKLEEETRELHQAIESGKNDDIFDELGDLLFTIVNVARWQNVDAEEALRMMLRRFTSRFNYIEESAARHGRVLTDMSLAEMDTLWTEAKKDLNGRAENKHA